MMTVSLKTRVFPNGPIRATSHRDGLWFGTAEDPASMQVNGIPDRVAKATATFFNTLMAQESASADDAA